MKSTLSERIQLFFADFTNFHHTSYFNMGNCFIFKKCSIKEIFYFHTYNYHFQSCSKFVKAWKHKFWSKLPLNWFLVSGEVGMELSFVIFIGFFESFQYIYSFLYFIFGFFWLSITIEYV